MHASAPRVVAILPAFNEGDVIRSVVGDLVSQGVEVYLLDNLSTDDTVAEASAFLGQGLLHVERFPHDAGYPARNERELVWRDMMRRVEDVAVELGADWYLFTNADEFRESPWPGVGLREAIARVEAAGYNAISFELLNFRPVDDSFVPGTDVREALTAYEPGDAFDALQVKGWKSDGTRPDLVSNAGHDVRIPDRRVFPVPFLLRHYPIRGESHGRRKVLGERLPRFAAEERAVGMHVQYDELAAGERFTWDPAELRPYDGAQVRADLLARTVDDLLAVLPLHGAIDGARLPEVLGASPAQLQAADGLLELVLAGTPADDPRLWDAVGASGTTAAARARLEASRLRLRGQTQRAHRLDTAATAIDAAAVTLARSDRDALLGETRSFVTLAFADELAADPALLDAYAAAFGPNDDASLVIFGRDRSSDEVGVSLGPVVELLGLDDERCPDLLAVGQPATLEDALATHVRAIYSRRAPAGAFAGLPAFDDTSVDDLHTLAA
jgi:hypothetical protein